jgi:2'-5' RNA ligase
VEGAIVEQEYQGPLRLFAAILAPATVQAAVQTAQAALRAHDLAVRWVEPANVHLTLQFLGTTARERLPALTTALASVAETARPLTLRTASLGFFPAVEKRTRVVWLGLEGETERVAALQVAVVDATGGLGFVAEERPFTPHLTLGRVRGEASSGDRGRAGRAVRAVTPPAPVEWPVNDLALMVSVLARAGATYYPLGRWRLGSGQRIDGEHSRT